ncbi:hypothetical protein I5535_14725 [Rhodobacteraceae bacterium F11138]|nr:hypothetical protein [Rhodobacteraceae bacterium F11138]
MADTPKKTHRMVAAQDSAEKMVEELYRLAEIIQSPSGDSRHERADRKHNAEQRMAKLLKESGGDFGNEAAAPLQHEWVLDVLQDLAQYAETQELWDLNRLLVDARFVATQMLAEARAH